MQNINIIIKLLIIWMIILSGLVTIIKGDKLEGIHQQQQTNGSNVDQTTSTNCCNSSSCTTHRVEVQFTTKIIQNEYIVAFDGYYKSIARENYLKAALNGSKVKKKNIT